MCAYAASFVERCGALTARDGVVFTTLCDQMRRAAELAARVTAAEVFLMHVPATWKGGGPRRYYRDELERLGRYLVRRGGRTTRRARLPEAPAVRRAQRGGNQSPGNGVPLALLGGHAAGVHGAVVELLQGCGGRIAYDGTEWAPAPLDSERFAEDPLEELTRAYFDTLPHPFRRPDAPFVDETARRAASHAVRGIVVLRQAWCDLWHGAALSLRERLSVPVLDLELPGEARLQGRDATRLAAFVEMLQ